MKVSIGNPGYDHKEVEIKPEEGDDEERERESFIFRQHGPSVGIWRPPQKWHVAPSTGRLSCGLGGLSIYCTPDNVHGPIFARGVCVNKRKV